MSEPQADPAVKPVDPYSIIAEACRRLKLKPREVTLIRDCMHARTLVSRGSLLISPGRVPAAYRLIERGYMAQTPEQPEPFDPKGFGMVVVTETMHLNRLVNDANIVDDP